MKMQYSKEFTPVDLIENNNISKNSYNRLASALVDNRMINYLNQNINSDVNLITNATLFDNFNKNIYQQLNNLDEKKYISDNFPNIQNGINNNKNNQVNYFVNFKTDEKPNLDNDKLRNNYNNNILKKNSYEGMNINYLEKNSLNNNQIKNFKEIASGE